jgi:hypothetical protein
LGCTVAELLERISSEELTEWIALNKMREKEQPKEPNKNIKGNRR